jgi:hypothetical protein
VRTCGVVYGEVGEGAVLVVPGDDSMVALVAAALRACTGPNKTSAGESYLQTHSHKAAAALRWDGSWLKTIRPHAE